MKTSFDKTVYFPNEVAVATAKIDNKDCQLAVGEVKFCLKMEIEVTTGSGMHRKSFTN
jgi:hypothetical protein